MLDSIKRLIKKNVLAFLAVVLLVVGGILVIVTADLALPILGKSDDISKMDVKDIESMEYVKINIDKYNYYGILGNDSKSGEKYCIVLVGNEEKAKYMVVKLDKKYSGKLAKIAKECEVIDSGVTSEDRTTIEVVGKIAKMDSKVYDGLKSSLERKFSTENVEDYLFKILINSNFVKLPAYIYIFGLILIGIAVLIIVVKIIKVMIVIIRELKKTNKR